MLHTRLTLVCIVHSVLCNLVERVLELNGNPEPNDVQVLLQGDQLDHCPNPHGAGQLVFSHVLVSTLFTEVAVTKDC